MAITTLISESRGPFTLLLVEVTERTPLGAVRTRGWEVECSLCDERGVLLTRPEAEAFTRDHQCER